MNKLKIFPSIGIARVGNSDSFFLCPEKQDSNGIELTNDGNEIEVQDFKENGLVKKQGARFRIFEEQENGKFTPFEIPDNAKITWKVQLCNKKSATKRDDPNIFYNGKYPPQYPPNQIPLKEDSEDLIISSELVEVKGVLPFKDKKLLDGNFKTESIDRKINLGSIFTDSNMNLVVLGGNGLADGPDLEDGNLDFYYNEDWFDDTSDGFVKAEILFGDTNETIPIESAWVIVAPTDYAPEIKGVVTLHDQLLDIAKNEFGYNPESSVSFKKHILPIIERFRLHRWVEPNKIFLDKTPISELSNNTASTKGKRRRFRKRLSRIPLDGHYGNDDPRFKYTKSQNELLDLWVNGEFENDYLTDNDENDNSGEYLNKVVLDTTVGQGFFPGIEGGIILLNKGIFKAAFTLDENKIKPGDITALMALPWQADFLKCAQGWWPAQRPYKVYKSIESLEKTEEWSHPFLSNNDHIELIDNIHRLGFIKKMVADDGIVYVEGERDPELPYPTND